MTKNKLVCALAWRESEGEANKNYFVSLGFAAWIVQELYCFNIWKSMFCHLLSLLLAETAFYAVPT